MSGQVDINRDLANKPGDRILRRQIRDIRKHNTIMALLTSEVRDSDGLCTKGHTRMHVAAVRGYEPAKAYSEQIAELISEYDLKKSKYISDQLLTEIK